MLYVAGNDILVSDIDVLCYVYRIREGSVCKEIKILAHRKYSSLHAASGAAPCCWPHTQTTHSSRRWPLLCNRRIGERCSTAHAFSIVDILDVTTLLGMLIPALVFIGFIVAEPASCKNCIVPYSAEPTLCRGCL